ncbi:serine hydrolase domain-containing protein [Paenibacillus oceani]|uniref:Beta-lactamase family protein n=1 Tax=Paenibacillus oceani TaxID=2772510 RepID=A0A927H0N8_9BACL|nr:serine hydrolase domain-containing protein [Paenibacillus oceani]MBD2862669.1 beta-lactamase family protein [Paenibacillus oceani]
MSARMQVHEEAYGRYARLLDKPLTAAIEEGLTPCMTVAVVKDGRLVYRYAHGRPTLHPDDRRFVGADTAFNVGSITKIVTSALAVKLMEAGVWSMNDPVRQHVPEYPFADATVGHLLTHSAGHKKQPIANPARGEMETFLKGVYESQEREAAPGERAVYDTVNHEIVMDMIQRISGQPIEHNARALLFNPLGMKRTSYDSAIYANGEYVLPCSLDNRSEEAMFDRRAPRGGTGLHSTAEDLAKFASLFLSKGRCGDRVIFSEAAVDFMLRESTDGKFSKTPVMFIKTERDAYGCFADLNSPSAVGHPGFSGCMMMVDPVYSVAAAIVTNSQRLHRHWRNYKRLMNLIMGASTSMNLIK